MDGWLANSALDGGGQLGAVPVRGRGCGRLGGADRGPDWAGWLQQYPSQQLVGLVFPVILGILSFQSLSFYI